MLALVFPGEETALPHIGKALAAVELGDVLFKGEALAGLIGGGGVGLFQHFAEVDEVGLRGGALRERDGLPAFDKLSKRERHRLELCAA